MSLFDVLFGGAPSPLLVKSFQELEEMVEQSLRMFDESVAGLLGNAEISVDLEEMDDYVDAREREIRRRVIEHLAYDPKKDMVASLVMATMVHDAERLGDYARGLSEVIPLAKGPRSGPFKERLQDLADRLRPLFERTRKALHEDDAEMAGRIMSDCRALKKDFLTYSAEVADSSLLADQAVVYATGARMMRRMGSHLSNLASAIRLPYDQIRRDDEDV